MYVGATWNLFLNGFEICIFLAELFREGALYIRVWSQKANNFEKFQMCNLIQK